MVNEERGKKACTAASGLGNTEAAAQQYQEASDDDGGDDPPDGSANFVLIPARPKTPVSEAM